ncbi:DUF6255 family natural product biosynthesis protein [[Roseibacterium] beibuensis]|uniref:DUF6255 family natural product biosynthesis protein n=1 Tax=[Roseibacterium] beibuensis TaxID=1193142 RepID=UPI00217EB899|nr:DUF6255 family natural product biosynthesis protein [Roseibacterium beibuensis]
MPLKPLLCRHDFYWSERHGSDRCRRCGKRRAAEAVDVLTGEPFAPTDRSREVRELAGAPLTLDDLPQFSPAGGFFVDFDERKQRPPARSPALMRPSTKVLRAQAQERRDALMDLLDRMVQGARSTREEAIDAVLAVIEDAHSADPVLFGADAAGHFARLHDARSTPRC